jgi:hypothetical protein
MSATVEVETTPGTWERFSADCDCGGDVRRVTDYQVLSLGPGHQTRPMAYNVEYECATCGKSLTRAETP